MIETLIFWAIILFTLGLVVGTIGSISLDDRVRKIGGFLVIIAILLLAIVIISPKKPQSLKDKTLSQVATENTYHPKIRANFVDTGTNWNVWINSTKFTNISLDSFKTVIFNYQK